MVTKSLTKTIYLTPFSFRVIDAITFVASKIYSDHVIHFIHLKYLLLFTVCYREGEKFRGIKFRGFRGFLLNPRNVSRKFFRPAKITSAKFQFFSGSNREIREIFRP